jgi:alkylation response protein AidB-like acyl-CoA dehydrogenase
MPMSVETEDRPADDAGLNAFRDEARAWIAANFPRELVGRPAPLATAPLSRLKPEQDAWRKAVGAKGWGAPTWPKVYGGAGLSALQGRIIVDELARAGAYDPIRSIGTMMFGPTLLEFGSEAQKLTHLPGIARREVLWCQGFSEPGAGSDLASLQCRAEDKGDHWLLNGQKVWTSSAQESDWCFCLVRTDTSRKQGGISMVLFDMKTPGVEVRLIRLISGDSKFCETFLTDVRVPKAALVGALNEGWSVAKVLMQHERTSVSGASGTGDGGGFPTLPELARRYLGLDSAGRIADPDLRARIARAEMDAHAFALTSQRAVLEAKANESGAAVSSILKNAGTQGVQERAELALEILGQQGLGWEGESFSKAELAAVRAWLVSKATTIYGGTQEVQNNIIAKRILGLPDAPKG